MKAKDERLTISWLWFRDFWCPHVLIDVGGSAKFCEHYLMSDKPCRRSYCLEWQALKRENKANDKH